MASEATRSKIFDGITQVVKDLNLPEIKRVYQRLRGDTHANQQYPCIEIRRSDGPDEERPGTAEESETGYSFEVRFKFRSESGPNAKDDRSSAWYEQLAKAFRERNPNRLTRLPGVEGCRRVVITPLSDYEISQNTFQLVTGGVLVKAYVFEPRS